MKNWFLIMGFAFISFSLSAQNWQMEMGDEWFNEHQGGLQIGDTMPDVPLGTVMNNYTGKTRFYDFKGKLVILDFWVTGCSSCIAAFPHMEALQKKFGDQIQIFIANEYETPEQIDLAFKKKKYKLPNLPSIVDTKVLPKLFPVHGYPHHVWIDGNSIVRQRGPMMVTYEQKIKDLIEGKDVFTMNDISTRPSLNPVKPFYQFIDKSSSVLSMGSFFAPYNKEISPYVSSKYEYVIDSAAQTFRNTYVNQDVLQLYYSACEPALQKIRDKLIFSPNSNSGFYYIDYFKLYVRDTFNYTSSFLYAREKYDVTDQVFVKSQYCYEQITPLSLSQEDRHQYMLEDLNRYFGNLLGVNGKIEKRKVPCYVLIRTSKQDKLSTKSDKVEFNRFSKDGKKWIDRKSQLLKNILNSYKMNLTDKSLSFLDETGYNGSVDMILPEREEIGNMEDLRTALKPYDLDIIQAEREIDFIVIREKGVKEL